MAGLVGAWSEHVVLVLLQPDVCAQFDEETLSQAAASAFAETSGDGEGQSSAAAEAAAAVLGSECLDRA